MEHPSTHLFPSHCRLSAGSLEQPVSPCPGDGTCPSPSSSLMKAWSIPSGRGWGVIPPCILWPCGTGPSPGSIRYPWGHIPAPEKEGRRGPPVVWGGLQVPRTRAPAICFLQGSPFPFARCGRTEQTLMWSLSQVCFKTTKIQPLPPGSGFPWFSPDSPGAGWPQDAFPVSSWSERLVLEVLDPDSGVHVGQGDEIPELRSSNPNSCCSDPAAWGGPGSAVMLQLQNPSPNPLRSISR